MGRYLREHTNPPVFIISAVVVVAFVLWGVLSPDGVSIATSAATGWITTYFGWLYILSATVFVVFCLVLMFSRYGKVRLGPDDSRPEFGTIAWFSMLFTAGMGIGLVFYSVSEPVTHFTSPPTGEGGTQAAADNSMLYTIFHWGVHPWAIYIVLGLALGYFAFRRGLPLRPASALYPLIGNRIYGPIGYAIDILAVFGTLFGLATSLGQGALQVGAGAESVFGVGNTATLQIGLIIGITAIAIVSLMAGIDKGIRRLALINMYLAGGLMVLVFLVGAPLLALNSIPANLGLYLQNLPAQSFETFTGSASGQEWLSGWTLFYWGWWISWSPFVGMFLARISYGRTIRSFIAGALFAPTAVAVVWFSIFGSTALNILQGNPNNPLAEAGVETGLYVLMEQVGFGGIAYALMVLLAMLVVTLFFATSSDSGSLVVDILTNGGDPNPIWQQRVFWAIVEGLIAIVLLAAGAAGGASDEAILALQAASIIAGLPFAIVLILMAIGIAKGLSEERLPSSTPEPGPDTLPPDPGRTVTRQGTASPATQQISQQMRAENPTEYGNRDS